MGLATIDPHSHKVQSKLYKIPKFGVNRPKSKQFRYNHLKMSKFTTKCMVTRTRSDPIHFFVNFAFVKSLYLGQN